MYIRDELKTLSDRIRALWLKLNECPPLDVWPTLIIWLDRFEISRAALYEGGHRIYTAFSDRYLAILQRDLCLRIKEFFLNFEQFRTNGTENFYILEQSTISYLDKSLELD